MTTFNVVKNRAFYNVCFKLFKIVKFVISV